MIYLGLGSNLGKREDFLQHAVDELGEVVAIEQLSAVYETPPWGEENQPAFLNACLSAKTDLTPEALFNKLKQIEQKVGRKHSRRWGPREIDIDILFFNTEIIDSQRLTIPHPRLAERAFVLAPLSDIAGSFVHPVLKRTVTQLLAQTDASRITKFSKKLTNS